MKEQFAVQGRLEATVRLGIGTVSAQAADSGTAWASVEPLDAGHEPSARLAERAVIELVGDTLSVVVPESGRLFRRAAITVTLGLPADSGLAVKGGMVDVMVRGGVQALAVKIGSGDVDVDQATSAVAVKAGQTDVRIGSAGTVAVATGQGTLRADQVGTTSFKSGQGRVELGRTDGAVAVKGGAVQLDVREAGPGELVFDAGAGSASVGVAVGTTVQVDMTSAAGDVRCDLPLEASAPTGGAGLRVRLRTGSGNLRIASAAPAAT